jgi:hypothetical protein
MARKFIQHKKISLRSDPEFNEAWLHDRISEDPSILGLGDVRVIDRERRVIGGGRLDVLLFDEDNNRRFEVEIMLGATDPSHILRTIEYWDIERRRYPGYEHVAVLVAEDITTRFLNLMSLLSGSIPLVAIQLDALHVAEHIVLNFVHVLDQTDLRVDDLDDEDSGGGETDRAYWDQKAGKDLMRICDDVLAMINSAARTPQEFKFLRGYIGLRANGVVKNFVWFSPKRTKKTVHVGFRHPNSSQWKTRFEEAGVHVQSHRPRHVRISVTPEDFSQHTNVIKEAISDTVKEFDA